LLEEFRQTPASRYDMKLVRGSFIELKNFTRGAEGRCGKFPFKNKPPKDKNNPCGPAPQTSTEMCGKNVYSFTTSLKKNV